MTTEEIHNLERYVDYFLGHLDSLSTLSGAEVRDVLQLASQMTGQCEDKRLRNRGMELLYKSCFYMKLDLKELWNIYWILTRILFTETETELSEGSPDELYRYIFMLVSESITDTYERYEHTESNLVVIITSQFLGLGHAPTRRVLDYAYAIMAELNKSVIIINDSGCNYYQCECLQQSFFPNYLYQYDKIKVLPYKGINIPFMQMKGYMPDVYCISEVLRKIYQWKPELVYNIGGSSILADLCGRFTKTACLPCGTDIPVTMSQYLLVGRAVEESDEARIKRFEPYQQVVETVINYQFAESNVQYDRVSFGLRKEDFVIGIVGNRLDSEITDEFMLWMNDVLERFDVRFLLIGGIDDIDRIRGHISKNEKLCFTGRLFGAGPAIRLVDVYCNPKRKGGGRSSFEALAQGVPVFTLKCGDVYRTCGREFGMNAYSDFTEQIRQCIAEPAYLASLKEKALQRAEYLSDISRTQREILNKIL